MSKHVCCKHGRILKIDKNGVMAMELIEAGGKPYRLFSYDRWICPDPDCDTVILAGHGAAMYPGSSGYAANIEYMQIEFW